MNTTQTCNLPWIVTPDEAYFRAGELATLAAIPKRRKRLRKRKSQADMIFANAAMHGFKDVRKVGEGGLIDRPIDSNGWDVMPIGMYEGIIPPEFMQQAETVTYGVPIRGFLIASDIRYEKQKSPKRVLVMPEISPDWGRIAGGVGKVAVVLAIGLSVISVLPVVLGIGLFGAALVYDPLIIAVTAENEWVAVAEWWD